MVKYVCDFCDEKFDEKEDAITHESEGSCVRSRLDLAYRCMNQCMVDGRAGEAEKFRKETRGLLMLYMQFTREEYVPSDETVDMGFGLPLPVLSELEMELS